MLTASSIQSLARDRPNRHAPSAGARAARAAAEKTFSDSTTPMNARGSVLSRSPPLMHCRWSVACAFGAAAEATRHQRRQESVFILRVVLSFKSVHGARAGGEGG